jgi:hypothetical protein
VNVTQRIVGTGLALVIAVGGYGCRYALREAADDRADRIAEDAAEAVSGYEYEPPTTVTITVPETTAPPATEPGGSTLDTTPAPPTTEAAPDALPKGWPAGLALVDGLEVESTSDLTGPTVVGTVAGDVATVTDAARTQLGAAGFTVDPTRSVGGVTVATGPGATATVLISAVPEDPARVRVSYRIQLDG